MVDTVYQLFCAMEMKIGIYSNDIVTILLSNCTPDFRHIYTAGNLKKCFEQVYYMDWNEICRICDINNTLFVSRSKNEAIIHEIFHEKIEFQYVYVYNRYPCFYMIIQYLKNHGNPFIISQYEDGTSSYYTDKKPAKLWENLRDYMFYSNKDKKLYAESYLREPEFFLGKNKEILRKIPLIDWEKSNALSIINDSLQGELKEIQEEYIFLEDLYDTVGDLEAYINMEKLVADTVGVSNVIFKRHPRNKKTLPLNNAKILDSRLPWEVFVVNGLLENKVVVSYNCTGAYNSAIISNGKIKTIILLKIKECNSVLKRYYGDKVESLCNKIKEKYDDFYVPLNESDFINIIHKLK